MKKLFFLFILPLAVFGGQPLHPVALRYAMQQTDERPDRLEKYPAPGVMIQTAKEAKAWLQYNRRELQQSNVAVALVYERTSSYGKHYQFQQLFQGVPVYGAYIKMNTDLNGNIFLLNDHLTDLHAIAQTAASVSPQAASCIVIDGNLYALLKKDQTWYDTYGNVLRAIDHHYYLYAEDTPATGKVFNHDPLTSQQVIYGQDGTFKHFNDSNYALLNDQRVTVGFPATIDSGKYKLKSAYAVIQDFIPPTTILPASSNGVFDYLRGEDQFKDVMAYYHVLHTREYYKSLGFSNRMLYQQRIDAHSGGGDNSYFDPADTTLNFGTGGVPDAEDADVPVHEYTHALSFDISPVEDMGTGERRSVEEGMCDVIAAVQSYKASTFNWRKLYNFDGPNPRVAGSGTFWGGRNGDSYKTYLDLQNNPYSDCEIWTSCLLDIAEHNSMGHDSLVKLMLNSIYLMTKGTNINQAAQLMISTDSMMNGGAHQLLLGYFFNLRKLGPFPEAIEDMAQFPAWFELINTEAFAEGSGSAILRNKKGSSFDVELYDVNGRKVKSISSSGDEVVIEVNVLKAGMYLVRLKVDGVVYSTKLIRY